MTGHTKGPWVVDEYCVWSGDYMVASCDLDSTDAEVMAQCERDSHIIAAAPDLLEAHEPDRTGPDFLDWVADRMVHVYGESPNVDFVLCLRRRAAAARAAIAKARGMGGEMMILNCGPSWDEKHEANQDWHTWFAWKPVRVGPRECVWLETVERKGVYNTNTGPYIPMYVWEYRKIGDRA